MHPRDEKRQIGDAKSRKTIERVYALLNISSWNIFNTLKYLTLRDFLHFCLNKHENDKNYIVFHYSLQKYNFNQNKYM